VDYLHRNVVRNVLGLIRSEKERLEMPKGTERKTRKLEANSHRALTEIRSNRGAEQRTAGDKQGKELWDSEMNQGMENDGWRGTRGFTNTPGELAGNPPADRKRTENQARVHAVAEGVP